MSEAMSKKLEGVHVDFLRRITGQKAVRQEKGTCQQLAADKVLEKAVTQSLRTYTDRRQAIVAKWVSYILSWRSVIERQVTRG